MRRTIDLDQVRVVQADNYKGNPRVYLEIMDTRVLYSDPRELRRAGYLVGDEDEVNTDVLADMFRSALSRILARLLLEDRPDLAEAWSTETDREIDYVKPRLAEDPYED